MGEGSVFGLVITSVVSLIMVAIGLVQVFQKEKPVGFYSNGNSPKADEIKDVKKWNIKHGLIWIIYGVLIELGFWLGFMVPTESLQAVVFIGCILVPLPLMVVIHRSLEKKYMIKDSDC